MTKSRDKAEENVVSRRQFLGTALAVTAGAAITKTGVPAKLFPAGTPHIRPASSRETVSILDDDTNQIFKKGGIAEFEKLTGIRVSNYEQLSFADLLIKLPILFASHSTTYDVIMTWAGFTAEFGAAGWLQPLPSDVLPSDLLPGPLDAVTWNNVVYGVPKFASMQTMFYNKSKFKKAGLDPDSPPKNWASFVKTAQALTGNGQWGYANDMGAVDTAYQNFLRTLLLEGGELWDASYKVRFNSNLGVDALTRLAALLHTEKVMDPASLSTGDATNLNPLFADGTAAMIFAWPFAYATARQSMPKANIGNAVIPGIHLPTASIDGSEGFAISRYSQNQLAALEFLKFASSPYCQKRMVVEEGWLPVNRTLLSDPAMIAALPVIPTYEVASKYPIRRYGAPWYGQVCDNYLSTNVSKVMLGELKPKAALDEAAHLSQPVINNYLKRLHIS